MVRLDGLEIDRNAVRGHARRFDRQVFLDAWRDLLAEMGVDASLYAPSVPSLSVHGAQ
jgi:DNA/RNA-binding domain of Phe-tRNA-synthetase-like protein